MSDDRGGNILKKKSFWTRLGGGAAMIIILTAAFVIGYDVMLVFMCLISVIGMFELYRALKIERSLIAVIGYLTAVAHYAILRFSETRYIFVVYAIALILMLAVMVLTYPKYSLEQVFGAYFGIFYVAVTLSLMYLIRIHPPSGAYLVWLILVSAWGCDIFAYLIGMMFGKHPFVPKLSPKKSVEGAIGGLAGGVLLSFIYGLVVQRFIVDIEHAPAVFAVLGLFGAAAGQTGDLAASAIKRKTGIKDYGKLIPGQGGILDRFDSVILVAPIIYLATIYAGMMS